MSVEAKPKKPGKGTKPFGIPEAREAILAKLAKAATKGATSFVTGKTPAAKRESFDAALAALVSEGAVFADRSAAKPKYYLAAHKPEMPDADSVASKLRRLATSRFPEILTAVNFKNGAGLAANEKPFVEEAIQLLLAAGRIVELRSKKAAVYVEAAGLWRALSDSPPQPPPPKPAPAPQPAVAQPANVAAPDPAADAHLLNAYRKVVRETGFPAVAISTFQRECGLPLPALHDWLLARRQLGKAILSTGDWSLADDSRRAAAIELEGSRFLLVRISE